MLPLLLRPRKRQQGDVDRLEGKRIQNHLNRQEVGRTDVEPAD